jgi:hypothetical protein
MREKTAADVVITHFNVIFLFDRYERGARLKRGQDVPILPFCRVSFQREPPKLLLKPNVRTNPRTPIEKTRTDFVLVAHRQRVAEELFTFVVQGGVCLYLR